MSEETEDEFGNVCEAMDQAYMDGVKKGITMFAWWKDGVEYVGSCGITLKKALAEIYENHI